MLRGIGHYERSHRPWQAYIDDEAKAEIDPRWLRSKPWSGVISRHTTPGMVKECEKLGIPVVDLSDKDPFPGVPKIRPDNLALGHLGAEHFMERGFRKVGFTGFSNYAWARERRDGFVEATDPFQSRFRATEALDKLMLGETLESSYMRIDSRGVVSRQASDVLAVDDRNVAAALSYIREHVCEGLTVDQVLKHAAASRSQLEKKFRRFLGAHLKRKFGECRLIASNSCWVTPNIR